MNTWVFTIDGKEIKVDLEKGTGRNEYVIYVNGHEYLRETVRQDIFEAVDLTFKIDSQELHIVKVKDEFDLAIDGVLINHKLNYTKLKISLIGTILAILAAYSFVLGAIISMIQSNIIDYYVYFTFLFISVPCIEFPILKINISPFITNKIKLKRSMFYVIISWSISTILFLVLSYF